MSGRPDVLSTEEGRHNGGQCTLSPGDKPRSVFLATGSDVGPQLVTFTWSCDVFPVESPLAAPLSITLVGHLEFGVSAIMHRAEFDLLRGGSVTVTTTGFHFKASYPSAEGPRLSVLASASYGTKPGGHQTSVTLTKAFENANGMGVLVSVPAFARGVAVYPVDPDAMASGELYLDLCAADSSTLASVAPPLGTVDLINGTAFVRVRYTGTPPLNGFLLFTLAL